MDEFLLLGCILWPLEALLSARTRFSCTYNLFIYVSEILSKLRSKSTKENGENRHRHLTEPNPLENVLNINKDSCVLGTTGCSKQKPRSVQTCHGIAKRRVKFGD